MWFFWVSPTLQYVFCLIKSVHLIYIFQVPKKPWFYFIMQSLFCYIPGSFLASNLMMNIHSSTCYQKESQNERIFSTSTSDFSLHQMPATNRRYWGWNKENKSPSILNKVIGMQSLSHQVQRNLGKWDRWAETNFVMFNQAKSWILFLGRSIPLQLQLGLECLKSCPGEKGPGNAGWQLMNRSQSVPR